MPHGPPPTGLQLVALKASSRRLGRIDACASQPLAQHPAGLLPRQPPRARRPHRCQPCFWGSVQRRRHLGRLCTQAKALDAGGWPGLSAPSSATAPVDIQQQ
jgi:hypothetical protein